MKKFIRIYNISVSDVSTVTGLNNIELSPDTSHVDSGANDDDKCTDGSSFKEDIRNRVYKLEELMDTVIKRLDSIAHRMDRADKMLTIKSN